MYSFHLVQALLAKSRRLPVHQGRPSYEDEENPFLIFCLREKDVPVEVVELKGRIV